MSTTVNAAPPAPPTILGESGAVSAPCYAAPALGFLGVIAA